MEVRHPSFMAPSTCALARRYGVATVFADSDEYPSFADRHRRFRLCAADATRVGMRDRLCAGGHRRLGRARATGARVGEPPHWRRVAPPLPADATRDVFLFFISGAKERAPAAAVATLRLSAMTPAAMRAAPRDKAPPPRKRVGPSDLRDRLALCAAVAAEQERGDRQDDEDDEQDLGDAGRAGGDAAEAEQRRDQRDHEEHNGIVKHE
jgi:hypothetical protein